MRMLALMSMFLSAVSALAAGHGPGDGGGGDEVGLEFTASLKSAVEIIHVGGPDFATLARLDWTKIGAGMKSVAVDTKLYVVINGVKQESVAMNHPDTKVIEINRDRWNAIRDERVREGIALHETLSLSRLESTGVYPYSGLYLSLFNYAPDPLLGGGPGRDASMPSEIARVYPYRCQRRFFEGEGVNEGNVNCVAGQHLGFIFAEYTFYLYSSPTKNNLASKLNESYYPSGLCGLERVAKFTCDSAQEPEFGLSAKGEGQFVVQITMTAAPESVNNAPLQEVYGFAALPDSRGLCPANLVPLRPWEAQPMSVIDPLPTSFINNGSLNNIVLSTNQPVNFDVWRQPANISCDMNGNCSWPDGGMNRVQSVVYVPSSPILCVIPKGALQ